MSRLNPPPQLGGGVQQRPPPRQRSDSHSSNSSSSTDTSEEEERQRQEILGEFGGPPSVVKPIASVVALLGLLLVLHLAGLWLFTRGFLLTRITLDGVATCSRAPTPTWTPPPPPPPPREGVSEDSDQQLMEWDRLLETPGNAECTLPPAFTRSLVVIIDSLRFDFIADVDAKLNLTSDDGNPTRWMRNAHYHSVLSLPARLDRQTHTAGGTRLSLLAHFLADAPTTTLQRLKGLTTGTLPTFIDAGSNFAGAEIGEDSWLAQLRSHQLATSRSGKARMGFMGDDTWLATFPNTFDANWTWPFDSFNVEDLDTVDRGVEASLRPFLDARDGEEKADWKLLVAHTLGVDHVGHRFGASHPRMRTKLEEMEAWLSEVVEKLPEDALLVLLGDHGMDEHGDHGGDGELEVGSALWVYAKRGFDASTRPQEHAQFDAEVAQLLSSQAHSDLVATSAAFSPLPVDVFGLHRSVPQIDLVPSFALLLGLPIPFNNLGTVVPELFAPHTSAGGSHHRDRLLRALRINARQVNRYLRSYAAKSDDLAPFEAELRTRWLEALRADAAYVEAVSSSRGRETRELAEARADASAAYMAFTRTSLVRARSVWAQFEMAKMALGLVLLALSVALCVVLRQGSLHGLVVRWVTREEGEAAKSRAAGTKAARRVRVRRRVYAIRTQGIEGVAGLALDRAKWGAAVGGALGIALWIAKLAIPASASTLLRLSGLDLLDLLISGSALGVQLHLLAGQRHIFLSSRVQAPGALRLVPWSVLGVVAVLLPLVHAAGIGSVAFVIWEDFGVGLLLLAALALRAAHAQLYAPTPKLRRRIVVLALGAAGAMRLAALVRVCREEQAPHCRSTFYAGDHQALGVGGSSGGDGGADGGAATNSPWAMGAAYVVALSLPWALGQVLSQSKSLAGVAPFFLTWIVRPTLLLGAGYWLTDWAAPQEELLSERARAFVAWLKLAVARVDLVAVVVIGGAIWLFAPLCLEMRREAADADVAARATSTASAAPGEAKPAMPAVRVIILGFANSMGSSYVLLVSLVLSLLFLVAQPMGQLALALCFATLVALAELGDSERDADLLRRTLRERKKSEGSSRGGGSSPAAPTAASSASTRRSATSSFAAAARAAASAALPASPGSPTTATSPPPLACPTLLETSTLCLLGVAAFFATGHQATFASIQWRTAFVGVSSVVYPLSPILVSLNAFGALVALPTLGAVLLALWNVAPRPRRGPQSPRTAERAKTMAAASKGDGGERRQPQQQEEQELERMPTASHLAAATLGVVLYHSLVTLSTAASAAWLRRHLMLFKLWTPRYMLGAATLLLTDAAAAAGVVAAGVVMSKTATMFGSAF